VNTCHRSVHGSTFSIAPVTQQFSSIIQTTSVPLLPCLSPYLICDAASHVIQTTTCARQSSPLFEFALSRGSSVLVQSTEFTIRFYLLTPWSRVLPEKLKRPKLLKKFPACYGTRKFITAFTRSRHLSLSWARLIQSMPPPHSTSRRSILILSSHLRMGLPSGLVPSGFPTKALYAPLLPPIRATCPAHLSLLDLITRMIFGEEYRVLGFTYHI
jgi:hypothetical protein